MTIAKQASKGNDNISKTASSTSIDQTTASETSLDPTYGSEGPSTCTSQDDLKTAVDGNSTHTARHRSSEDVKTAAGESAIHTARHRSTEDLKTASDGNSTHTARHRSSEDVKTAAGEGAIRTARHRSTEDLKTAAGESSTRTARHRSTEDVKTAAGEGAIHTARHRSTEDLKTAAGESSTRTARHRSTEDVKTAAGEGAIHTARHRSTEDLKTAAGESSTRTARHRSTEDVKTATGDVLTAIYEPDVQTSRNIESSLGTCRSNENLKTAKDSALRTAVRSSKSEDDISTSIEAGADISTALMKSMSNINTAGSINTCSMQSVHTAYDLTDEQIQELINTESEYCMDVTPDAATSSLTAGAVSQYQLTDLRNYSALNDPTAAYQYKIQESLPPNYNKSVSATESEYLAPDMTGSA